MTSKGPRSKLDHETRTRRQKALEAPREPRRPKTHWDHVLEEMVWLSKDFESERKWKISQAKRVALRASKSVADQANRGEKRLKEEEQRLRRVALNISKDVKKFWSKIEKLVHYKHQLELEERKKKALDKQLDFLLGQTERYSNMLAENLGDISFLPKTDVGVNGSSNTNEKSAQSYDNKRSIESPYLCSTDTDDDEYKTQSDEPEDDERTIEEEECKHRDVDHNEELSALRAEAEQPLDEILKSYENGRVSREGSTECMDGFADPIPKDLIKDSSIQVNGCKRSIDNIFNDTGLSFEVKRQKRHQNIHFIKHHHWESIGKVLSLEEQDDNDYVASDEGKDDEATLSEEEELAKKEIADPFDEIKLLQKDSEVPLEELLARYKKDGCADETTTEDDCSSSSYENEESHVGFQGIENNVNGTGYHHVKSSRPSALESSIVKEEVARNKMEESKDGENIIADAAAAARLAQPTGNTFLTTNVRTKIPFLLKYSLREYQHIGLDWLVTMYEKRLNGILADEMGLGKTIMTIALLAHLASEKGIWGPHLIVVPTSVMLNWETEFLKWCPAFKILTYFGSAKERKQKRQGWLKPNYFHVCVTTYRLIIQDSKVFKRKKWKYLILDEAHLIKNWKSQRWQTLLNFNSKRRILLTGTPLQNDLMELWSLMHFLMPHVFQSHQEFKDWFCNPISGMVEGQEKVNKVVVDRLHNVLRPFILRRLKRDVEKQLPKKHEHVIYCRLSRRQRNLYEDFIASSETQATLATANYFGMISIIMQLRKVCNHPDLFEGRPIISSFDMVGIDMQLSSLVCSSLEKSPFSEINLGSMNLLFTDNEFNMTSWEADEANTLMGSSISGSSTLANEFCPWKWGQYSKDNRINIFEAIQRDIWEERRREIEDRRIEIEWWNRLRCQKRPVYGTNAHKVLSVKHPVLHILEKKEDSSCYMEYSSKLANLVLPQEARFQKMLDFVESFMFAIPAARAPSPVCWCSKGRPDVLNHPLFVEKCTRTFSPLLSPYRPAIVRRQLYFPDRRLIQFDCGKLQELAILLRRLKSEGHRALIFTQMTKMLDVLEEFINLYGYTYLRLDGSTPPEERQTLMQRFNTNPKFFLFILSTRSGGVGINLVGADTVIFYDSDWNPAMDQQAQDRCHRIGQTREVHIYRLISESTIEENILKKANQKRALDDLVIQSGSYNTEFLKKLDPMEIFSGHTTVDIDGRRSNVTSEHSLNELGHISTADVEAAIKHAEDEADYLALKRVEQEEAVDNQEFNEEVTCRSEEDDIVIEDDSNPDHKFGHELVCQSSLVKREDGVVVPSATVDGADVLNLTAGDEEIDMLADVKQMAAAAAAAGQASSSFENQLRPIDRYAMRFLDLWDPIIDKLAVEYEENVEEQEWELDRIEKFKEDLEAEIDEDQEPLLYESWDAEYATTAYRQHVEALTQRQLLEEQERRAQEAQEMENNCLSTRSERKGKVKKQKMKKPLRKTRTSGKLKFALEESSVEHMILEDDSDDDDEFNHDVGRDGDHYEDDGVGALSPEIDLDASPANHVSTTKRKRAAAAVQDEENVSKSSKKTKTPKSNSAADLPPEHKQHADGKVLKLGEVTNDDGRMLARTKTEAKLNITYEPVKRVITVKPEKFRKKGNTWLGDFSPDSWANQEDVLLCAAVHEYGPNWDFISDLLYGIPSGGSYRGRFRHPVHCCERFRELFFKYILSSAENTNPDKVASGVRKAALKMSEEQVQTLLSVTSQLPDRELLIQKHFVAIVSSVWRSKCRNETHSSANSFHSERLLGFSLSGTSIRVNPRPQVTNYRTSPNRVMLALTDDQVEHQKRHEPSRMPDVAHSNTVELDLELYTEEEDHELGFPSRVTVSLCEPKWHEPNVDSVMATSSTRPCPVAENHIRKRSEACFEVDKSLWASSSGPSSSDWPRQRPGSKHSGKHKVPGESSRPGKLKVHRVDEPHDNSLARSPDLSLEKALVGSSDQTMWQDYGTCDLFTCPPEGTEEVVLLPHEYDPSFLFGTEDYFNLQDIG